MRRPAILSLALLALLALPAPALAWGSAAHYFITERAIALLPPALRPFFEARKAYIVERSIDPDLWRNAGFAEEPPQHFIDFGFEGYGPYPFEALPRSHDQAVAKFGPDVVTEMGTLPWRTAEFHGRLRREFAALTRSNAPPYALDNIAFYAAALAHYVGDATQPFHAHINYDGQLTNQRGLHARFETDLFVRRRPALALAPVPQAPVLDPRDRIFAILLDSYQLVDPLLAADKAAVQGREFYDDGYFAAFAQAGAADVMDRRLNEAVAAIAAFITGAWEQAGKPAVPLELPRTPRRIPKD
jgi:hypothetical protein